MSTSRALLPTDAILQAYGLGRLDDASSGSVNAHLKECPDCRGRIVELSSNSSLGRDRGANARPVASGPAASSANRLSGLDAGAAMPAPPPASTLPPGLADLPDHEILKELGRGGMGVVYLARNKLMDRMEVLKVVGGHLVSRPGVLERFLREIRSAARLQHSNIVTAYSALRLGEGLVLTMEYVEGLDLARLVKARGPLPVANACNYAHQAALGLQHAHEHGMVHRDIKPANLILARASGREGKAMVKVLDFGLAKVTSEGQADSGLTREGQMLGTPDYIAPEQIRDAQSSDIRADIYSLGCTLYYLLIGRAPFTGANLWDIYQAHFSMDADPLNLARAEVPVELSALVAKMMAKEPARRFQEPKEVAQALKPFFKAAHAAVPVQGADVPRAGRAGTGLSADGGGPVGRPTTATEPSSPSAWQSSVDLEDPAHSRTGTLAPPTRRPAWLWPAVAVGAALLGLVVAWGVTVRVSTANGTIELVGLPKDAEVFVDDKQVEVTWPGGGRPAVITVDAGKHRVKVEKDGLKVSGREVTIQAGGNESLTVQLITPDDSRRAATSLPVIGSTAPRPASPAHPGARATFDRNLFRIPKGQGQWRRQEDELSVMPGPIQYPIVLFGDTRWTDYDFTVKAMRVGGADGFSLVMRSTDDKDHIVVALAMLRNQLVDVVPIPPGRICEAQSIKTNGRNLLQTHTLGLSSNRWYTASVRVRGDHIECFLQGDGGPDKVFDFQDTNHPVGRVGLQVSRSNYRFKDIRVTAPDGTLLWEGPPAIDPSNPAVERPAPGPAGKTARPAAPSERVPARRPNQRQGVPPQGSRKVSGIR